MTTDTDTFGWPIRLREDNVRICARPECCTERGRASEEFRIDGYCSCECRDMHEVEQERDALSARIAALEQEARQLSLDLQSAEARASGYCVERNAALTVRDEALALVAKLRVEGQEMP